MRWDPIAGQFRVYEFGGGGSAPSSTTTVAQNFSPEEAAQRTKVQEEAARIYAQSSGQIANAPYPGASPVPFSPATLQAQQAIQGFATGAGQQQATNAGNFSQFMMGPAQYAESNPYLSSAIDAAVRPVTEAYTQPGGAFSQIRQGAQQAGQYGGSRQGIAEGIAGRSYLNTVGDIGASMANQNYQNSQEAALRALVVAPQTFQMGMAPGAALAGVGQQQEMLSQAQEDYSAQSRMWGLNAPWTPLQNYANIVFGGATPGTTTQSTGSAASQNRFGSTIGLAAQGAALGSQIMPGAGTLIGGGLGLLAGLFG